MTAPTTRPRSAADACPGLGRPFSAADGTLVRLRPAGRAIEVDTLVTLMNIIAKHHDPSIQLTSRAALQLRGLPDPLTPDVRAVIAATGLVPSVTHELVRNIIVSPLSGLDSGGLADVRTVAANLDSAVCAEPALTRLGGRFLFAVDDGRGDVIGEGFDLGLVMTGPDRCVVLAGRDRQGWEVSLEAAVPLLVDLALDFVQRASGDESDWHVADLAEPLQRGDAVETMLPLRPPPPLGAVGPHAVVAVPLGLLRPSHVAALARVTDEVRLTPWRSLVVEEGASSLSSLEAAGLVTHADSPWSRLHACTGLPGCTRSTLDTRALAVELAPVLPNGRLPVHISGCARRCGTPSTAYVDVLSPISLDDALATITTTTRVPALATDTPATTPPTRVGSFSATRGAGAAPSAASGAHSDALGCAVPSDPGGEGAHSRGAATRKTWM
ncbi:MAG: precorrin-3B synthase [Humibacillus sp.]